MKKSISIVLVLSIIASFFAMCGVTAFAEENNILDYITYEIDEYYEGVVILSCDPSISGDVVIPNTIDGYPVKVIDLHAFSDCNNITSVYIPENIIADDELLNFFYGGFGLNVEEYIVDENNSYFFSDDDGVVYSKDKTKLVKYPCGKSETEFVIPDSVTSIGTGAFYNCSSLVNVTISDSVEKIEFQAFMYCSSLKNIEIPDSVIFMSYGIFEGCTSLSSAVIGNGVKNIDGQIFADCINLESLVIGSSAENLDSYYNLPSLKNITVSENNPYYSSVDGCLLSKDGTELISYPVGKGDILKLPECVTTIGEMACFYNMFLKEIDLSGINKIELGAFGYGFDLEKISIPETVSHIEMMSFYDCHGLTDVYIYNPDVVLEEYSIGFVDYEILIDLDEYIDLFKKANYSENKEDRDKYTEICDNSISICEEIQPLPNLTIHGYAGSTAETYANENGFKFVPICRHNYVDTVITPATYTQTGVGGNVCEFCEDVLDTYEIPMLEIEDSEEKIDKDTGVSVVFPEGTFEGEAEIEVKPVEDGEAYKLISHKEGNYKVTMFDINVTVDGENVQPNGTVLVQIPLPKGYNQNKCVVYYVADDGTMEELKTYHNKDGYVYFETDHFSYYAILEETTVTEDNSTETENHFISYLRSLLNKYIAAFLKFIDMLKSLFGLA